MTLINPAPTKYAWKFSANWLARSAAAIGRKKGSGTHFFKVPAQLAVPAFFTRNAAPMNDLACQPHARTNLREMLLPKLLSGELSVTSVIEAF